MEGYGFYQYADKVRYDGQFLADKKQGYGVYTWTDGRRYEGWWSKGKQHGYGTYKNKDGTIKHGLWENGKRLKWFNEDAVNQINNNNFDVSTHFKEENSSSALPTEATFNAPADWEKSMLEVRDVLDVPLENIGIATDLDQ